MIIICSVRHDTRHMNLGKQYHSYNNIDFDKNYPLDFGRTRTVPQTRL